MPKTYFIAVLLSLFCAFSSQAKQVYGASGSYLKLKNTEGEVNGYSALFGYEFGQHNLTFTPMLRYIKGNKTAVYGRLPEADFEQAAVFGVKAQYKFDFGVYLFTTPSYSEVSYVNNYWGQDEWKEDGMGITLGFGYTFSDLFSTEIYYDEFSEFQAINAGINIHF